MLSRATLTWQARGGVEKNNNGGPTVGPPLKRTVGHPPYALRCPLRVCVTGRRMASSASVQLEALAQRKYRLEEELREVEKQLYHLETSYLNDSSAHGNVLRGFEGFLGPAKPQKCVAGGRSVRSLFVSA